MRARTFTNMLRATTGFTLLLGATTPAVTFAADQMAAAGGDTLDEIIVTARRREENLQTVPVAISAIQGDTLDNTYTVNAQSLATLTVTGADAHLQVSVPPANPLDPACTP